MAYCYRVVCWVIFRGIVMSIFLPLILFGLSIPCFSQIELIKNGDFSDSTSKVWLFGENGASATASVDHQRYQIIINSPGNSLWSPQLQQVDFTLLKDTAYTLKFDTWATSAGKIEVILCSSDYKKYLDTIVDISSVKTSFVINWIMNDPSDKRARIQFNFGHIPSPGVIGLDNVSLVQRNEPVIRVLRPDAASRLRSGTSDTIKWTNSGLLERVNIRYSVDGGESWIEVADSVENKAPRSFIWGIPQNAYGNNCLVLISSPDGLYSDTSESFSVLHDVVDSSVNNLVQNSSFHDKSGWSLQVISPAAARDTVINEEMLVVINSIGNASWQVKLKQEKIALEKGKLYEFSFDAYSSDTRTIYANVGFSNGIPVWSVNKGDSTPIIITSEKKRYKSTFYMTYPSSKSALIEFNLGNNLRDVYFDNVVLHQIRVPQSEFLEPLTGQVLKCNDSSSIKWTPGPLSDVELQFSSDSGKTWSVIISEIVSNTGTVSWKVPDVSSSTCLLKIVNPIDGETIGYSGVFTINKFGAEIKSGELVTNGSFDDSLNGWNIVTLANGVAAVPELDAKAFGMIITSGGSERSDILLSQGGLILLSGNTYLMSFKAFSVSPRLIRVRLVDSDTSAADPLFIDTLINLPLTVEDFRFEVRVPGDCNARIEYFLGGDTADVYIDNVSLRILSVVKSIRPTGNSQNTAFIARTLSDSKIEFRSPLSNSGIIDIFTLQGVRVTTLSIVNGYALLDKLDRNAGIARGTYLARIKADGVRATILFSSSK